MTRYTRERKVRFGDVDYAGIIFYPRYFEALNAMVEDWFAEDVGQSFKYTHDTYGIGTPLVAINAELKAPSRLGEILTYALHVERIGATSLTLKIDTTCGDEQRMHATLTHVCAKAGIDGACPWPAPLKEKFLEMMEARS